LKEFLAEFEDVVFPSKILPPVCTDVETSGPPIASRFRRLEAETSILYLSEEEADYEDGCKIGLISHENYFWI
jgi:hypothetical protein